MHSAYMAMGVEHAGQRDQALQWCPRQEGRTKQDIDTGLQALGAQIPAAHRAIIALLFLGREDITA